MMERPPIRSENRRSRAPMGAEGPSLRVPTRLGWLAVVPATFAIVLASLPGFDLPWALICVALWSIAAVGWVGEILRARRARSDSGWRTMPRSWAIAPAVLLTTAVVVVSGLPLSARFALSRPAFEQFPDRNLSYDVKASAGMYEVCCFERTAFGYQFGVSEGQTMVWGFAVSPDGPPAGPDIVPSGSDLQEGENSYRHLDGPWYVWEFRWT